jgi:hypothetical protein
MCFLVFISNSYQENFPYQSRQNEILTNVLPQTKKEPQKSNTEIKGNFIQITPSQAILINLNKQLLEKTAAVLHLEERILKFVPESLHKETQSMLNYMGLISGNIIAWGLTQVQYYVLTKASSFVAQNQQEKLEK